MHPPTSLTPRLVGERVLLALTTAGIAGVAVDRTVQRHTLESSTRQLDATARTFGQMTASALFGDLDPNDTSLNPPVRALAHAVDAHLSLVTPDGAPVADSDRDDPRSAGSQRNAPEVRTASRHGVGSAVRAGRLWVARSIERDGRRLGYARASIPMARVDRVVVALRWQAARAAGGAVLIALVLAALISVGIVRPVRRLADDARRIGGGDLGHRATVRGDDEIGALARAFNDMTASLEGMVRRLDGRNRDMRMVLDTMGQGLLMADRHGVVLPERSAPVDQWFGPIAPDTRVWDLFREASPRDRLNLQMNWEQLFEDMLPVEVTLAQLPSRVTCGEVVYEVSYEPIREGGEVSRLLLVLSDVTASVYAERMEAEQRDLLAAFNAMTRDRKGFEGFLSEADALVEGITEGAPGPVELKRAVHTLKGIASLYGVRSVASLCHEIETRMADDEPRLTAAEREQLTGTWRGLRDKLAALGGGTNDSALDVRHEDVDALQSLIERGEEHALLAQIVGSWKMEPVDRRLARLGEQAKQLAERLGKTPPDVVVAANGVRLDAQRWAPFWSVFSHVVRNAADHGLEAPDERAARHKPARGRIELRAWADRHGVLLELRDDGGGIQWERLREKARAHGLPSATHDDLVAALFTDGVSTRDEVTETSGRGVGMAAVRAVTESLRGTIEVESAEGQGTTFRFRFPLNAAVNTLYAASRAPRVLSVPAAHMMASLAPAPLLTQPPQA